MFSVQKITDTGREITFGTLNFKVVYKVIGSVMELSYTGAVGIPFSLSPYVIVLREKDAYLRSPHEVF